MACCSKGLGLCCECILQLVACEDASKLHVGMLTEVGC